MTIYQNARTTYIWAGLRYLSKLDVDVNTCPDPLPTGEHQGEGAAFWLTIAPLLNSGGDLRGQTIFNMYNQYVPSKKGMDNKASLYCKGKTLIKGDVAPAFINFKLEKVTDDCSLPPTNKACPKNKDDDDDDTDLGVFAIIALILSFLALLLGGVALYISFNRAKGETSTVTSGQGQGTDQRGCCSCMP